MGSFANSLLVYTTDAEAVIAACARLERKRQIIREASAHSEAFVQTETGCHVTAACGAWVGVLHAELERIETAAAKLSQELHTHVLSFLVNDSDSWHYQLFLQGKKVEEFNSTGNPGALDLVGEIDEATFPAPSLQAIQEAGKRVEAIVAEMKANMPPEMRALQEKIARQQITPEELHQLAKLGQAEQLKYQTRMMAAMLPIQPAGTPRKSPPKIGNAKPDSTPLDPILPNGITVQQVLDQRAKSAVFAEEIMADFMKLIGIPPVFAYLSYEYLAEFTPAELRTKGVELIGHVRSGDGEQISL